MFLMSQFTSFYTLYFQTIVLKFLILLPFNFYTSYKFTHHHYNTILNLMAYLPLSESFILPCAFCVLLISIVSFQLEELLLIFLVRLV